MTSFVKNKILLYLWLLALLIPTKSGYAFQIPEIWGDLKPGKYEVGFKGYFIEDQSRSFFSNDTLNLSGRPIRVLMWYPANVEKTSKTKITLGDYVDAKVTDSSYSMINNIFNTIEYNKTKSRLSPNKSTADSLYKIVVNEQMYANSNPKVFQGKYPLVIHSLGRNSSQLESFVLWEYLASYGYVVVVIPQLGESPSKFASIAWDKNDLEVQKKDLEFTIEKLKEQKFIDSTKIAFIGYSSGGVIGNWLSEERSDIDLLITLDGSNISEDGVKMLEEIGTYPKEINIPVLNIYNPNNHLLNYAYMDGMDPQFRYDIKMYQTTHFDYNQWPLYYYLTGMADERGIQWRKPEDAAKSYELICQLTATFLNSKFKSHLKKNDTLSELSNVLNNTELAEIVFN